jgi:hypothetical protein
MCIFSGRMKAMTTALLYRAKWMGRRRGAVSAFVDLLTLYHVVYIILKLWKSGDLIHQQMHMGCLITNYATYICDPLLRLLSTALTTKARSVAAAAAAAGTAAVQMTQNVQIWLTRRKPRCYRLRSGSLYDHYEHYSHSPTLLV